jgi:hypothetical protein
MANLLFFSRVALICNACFAITFLLHYIPFISKHLVPATIIIMGTVLAILVNGLTNLLYILIILARKQLKRSVPGWLIATNFLFFIFQCILLIK